MREYELEKYFDNDLYLVRFSNIRDLEKRLHDDKDLKIIDFGFKDSYDDNWQDYELMLTVEDTDKATYDLDIWYAITRTGERIIVETNFEKIEY